MSLVYISRHIIRVFCFNPESAYHIHCQNSYWSRYTCSLLQLLGPGACPAHTVSAKVQAPGHVPSLLPAVPTCLRSHAQELGLGTQGKPQNVQHIARLGVLGKEENRVTESQNISSWKGPIRIMESNSLLLAGLPKTKSYD